MVARRVNTSSTLIHNVGSTCPLEPSPHVHPWCILLHVHPPWILRPRCILRPVSVPAASVARVHSRCILLPVSVLAASVARVGPHCILHASVSAASSTRRFRIPAPPLTLLP